MQDARCKMQDAGCRVQDAGCRLQVRMQRQVVATIA
ncbi:MAG TPA: phosphotransferase [Chloroflexi bacterium]|nr:phosphotransferase [Chloroflexota bacterium]